MKKRLFLGISLLTILIFSAAAAVQPAALALGLALKAAPHAALRSGPPAAPDASMLAVSNVPFSDVELLQVTEIPAAPAVAVVTPIIPLTGGCKLAFDAGFEAEVVALINAERAKFGLPALERVESLVGAAKSHTNDMACNQFFSHNGSDGATVWDRIEVFGYAYTYAGENVAGGFATPKAVVAAWMSSPGHRANILSDKFMQVGVGYAYTEKGAYHHVVTANFGAP